MWHTGDRMASNRLSQIWRDTFFHFSSFSLLYLSATTASSGHTSGHCTSRSIHLTITSCCMSSSRVSSPPLFRNRSTTSGRSAGMACVCGEFSDAIKLSHSWMTSGTVSKPLPDLYEDRVLANGSGYYSTAAVAVVGVGGVAGVHSIFSRARAGLKNRIALVWADGFAGAPAAWVLGCLRSDWSRSRSHLSVLFGCTLCWPWCPSRMGSVDRSARILSRSSRRDRLNRKQLKDSICLWKFLKFKVKIRLF